MSDHGDRRRLWMSLKERLSARRASANHNNNTTDKRGARNQANGRGGGISREKNEFGSPSCLPVPHHRPGPSALLCSTKQQFKLLDDDTTFSTKPLIGFASRYNRHYSEVWLADYINSTRNTKHTKRGSSNLKFAPRTSSKKKTQWQTTQVTIADTGDGDEDQASDPAQDRTSPVKARDKTVSSPVQGGARQGIGREIDRLSKTLGIVAVGTNGSGGRGGRAHRHVGEFDVASATSHTSSLDTEEFSFQADWPDCVSGERNIRSSASVSTSSHVSSTSTWDEIKRKKSELLYQPVLNSNEHEHEPKHVSPARSNRSSASVSAVSAASTSWDEIKRKKPELFQPVLDESYDHGDIILVARPTTQAHERGNHHEIDLSGHSTTNNVDSSRGRIATEPFLDDSVIDMTLDMFERRMEEALMYPQQQPFLEIRCKSDESHILSDITDSAVGMPPRPPTHPRDKGGSDNRLLGKEEEHVAHALHPGGPRPSSQQDHADRRLFREQMVDRDRPLSQQEESMDRLCSPQAERMGRPASAPEQIDPLALQRHAEPANRPLSQQEPLSPFKRARCVVVYDKKLADSERILYDDVPANVKEMVDRLEVLRQMEAQHAEKFGYKDFLPIPVHEEQNPPDPGTNFLSALSYSLSFESDMSLLLSSVGDGNSQRASF